MTEERLIQENIGFIRACARDFLRCRGLSMSEFYEDAEQEAAIGYLIWHRKLIAGEFPEGGEHFARRIIFWRLHRAFHDAFGVGVSEYAIQEMTAKGLRPGDVVRPRHTMLTYLEREAAKSTDFSGVYVSEFISEQKPIDQEIIRMGLDGEKDIAGKLGMSRSTLHHHRKMLRDRYHRYSR